jgi:hypothetical protein
MFTRLTLAYVAGSVVVTLLMKLHGTVDWNDVYRALAAHPFWSGLGAGAIGAFAISGGAAYLTRRRPSPAPPPLVVTPPHVCRIPSRRRDFWEASV